MFASVARTFFGKRHGRITEQALPTNRTLFAGMGMIDSFITIVGTTVSSAVYSATVTYFRGFVFLMFAGISCEAVILIIVLWVAGMVGGASGLKYQEEEIIVTSPEIDKD